MIRLISATGRSYGPSLRNPMLIVLGFVILYIGSDAERFPRLCVIFTAIAAPVMIAMWLREVDKLKG